MPKHKSRKPENNLWAWIILTLGAMAMLLFFVAVSKNLQQSASQTPEIEVSVQTPPVQTPSSSIKPSQTNMPNELQIQDLTIGTGAEAKVGSTVIVHYTGTLANGDKFDSSSDRNQPFSFTIGQGQVIQGWEQGIPGMKVGGRRKLVIPPSLGYGSQQVGPIPANSTLIFEVELLEVK